jgi:hypothetical protein
MATANLTLPDGTKVNIEGTADEVAILLAKCSSTSAGQVTSENKTSRAAKSAKKARARRKGPLGLIDTLAEEGFFKSKRNIAEVQKKLEEKGHIYAQESLSGALLRLTRDKHVLRRIKEKAGWVYVS